MKVIVKDEIVIPQFPSLCLLVIRLGLIAALKDCANTGGILSMPRKFSITRSPPNLFVGVSGTRNSSKEPIYHQRKTIQLNYTNQD